MKPFYYQTFRQAWSYAFGQSILWPLGFFSAFFGVAGSFRIIFDLPSEQNINILNASSAASEDFVTSNFINWSNSFYQIPWTELKFADAPLVALLLLIFAVIIFLTVVAVSSEGALAKGVAALASNAKNLSYLKLFRSGIDKFWDLFILRFVYSLIYIFFLAGLVLPLFLLARYFEGGILLGIAVIIYLILIPFLIVLDIIVRYGIILIMLNNLSVRDAFHEAWIFFKQHWIISLETAIFIFAWTIGYVIIAGLVIGLVFLFFSAFLSMISWPWLADFMSSGLIGLLIFLTFASITFLKIFDLGSWTLLFKRLASGDVHHAKLIRMAKHSPWVHKKLF